MKKYNILTKNSNGKFSHFKEVTLKGDDEADKVVNNLKDDTDFDYKWEFVEDIEIEEEVEEVEEDKETSTEDTEDTEEVKEEEVEEESEKDTEVVEKEQLDDSLFQDEIDEDIFPLGWHRRKEFVAHDGTVYRKGEEQPDEYRTIEPTKY